jgi:hypothetical protein
VKPLERRLAEAQLRGAFGDNAEIETDADGDLLVSVSLPDGRLSGSIASLDSLLLRVLAGGGES